MKTLDLTVGNKYNMIKNVHGIDEEEYEVEITWLEEREDFFYIGYKPTKRDWVKYPISGKPCTFGCTKIKKNGMYKAINTRFEEL